MASRPGLTAKDVGFGSAPKAPDPPRRIFRPRGENEYSLEILPQGIEFYVSRLRRTSHELWGELAVKLTNGHFPHARTINGVLSVADMNFTSQTARGTRAKFLKERCGPDGEELDWTGFVEELSVQTISVEREGEPAISLAEYQVAPDASDSWLLQGLPILRRHPTVLYGKGASGKSYLAMWVAGQLVNLKVPVLYCDWELAGDDHSQRLKRLFQPAPTVHYILCRHPLRDQMDRIARLITQHHIGFVVFDSIGPASRASGNRYGDADLGQEYFGLVRRFGVGSLHVAHPPKNVEDGKDASIYGSAFFGYLARSIWFVQAADYNPAGQLTIALHHQKLTTGAKLAPLGYRLRFEDDRTAIEPCDPIAGGQLVNGLPLLERMKHYLGRESLTVKELSEVCDTSQGAVRGLLSRHKDQFVKSGQKYTVTRQDQMEF